MSWRNPEAADGGVKSPKKKGVVDGTGYDEHTPTNQDPTKSIQDTLLIVGSLILAAAPFILLPKD